MDQYKGCFYQFGENRQQLFDLRRDPGEVVNLAVEKRHRGKREQLRQALFDWCLENGDIYHERYLHPGEPNFPGVPFRQIAHPTEADRLGRARALKQ